MEFIHSRYQSLATPLLPSSVVTLGNFDGVHLGHQKLLDSVTSASKELAVASVVISFHPHPFKILKPEKAPPLLLPLREKVRLLEEAGVDFFVCLEFNHQFASLSAYQFIKEILVRRLGTKKIFVGRDYRFGRDRIGDVSYLRKIGGVFGFDVEVVAPVVVNGILVSSTRIRRLVMEGQTREAMKLLGRPYKVLGKVIKGAERGRRLGFPTANIEPENELIPQRGVYSVAVEIDSKIYPGVGNIGYNPTFDGGNILKLEVFIIDFSSIIYNKEIGVLFLDKIRDEVRFSSPDLLVSQIKRDVKEAKRIWEKDGLGT
jgi:riboflavin kinase/FMN adenylyltransferase